MCGILGSVNISFNNSLLDTIKHRGPDDFGTDVFFVNENLVQFGHRRLSIVDLSNAGHQPMTSECNNYSIIFNGEIYNYQELKKELPPQLILNGHSDTETILYYIREFGIDAVKDFNGIFAFAYLDQENEVLHLARDRYGVKPLYYYYNQNQLLFSSELRPIREIFNPEMDPGALGNCLSIRYYPAPLTPFKGVSKIEPGQILTFDLKIKNLGLTKKHYLNVPRTIGSRKEDYSLLVKTYGDLFGKAVERQLMSDVDVGVLLSGGIDSALVAAIAKDKSTREIKAFSVGFEGDYAGIDEIEHARETADLLGLKHFTKRCDFTDLITSIKKTVEIVEEPIGTTSTIPMFFLSELASAHVKVVLSGQGADEPLGGYVKYKGVPMLGKVRALKFIANLLCRFAPFFKKKEQFRRVISSIGAKDNIQAYINYNTISSLDEIYQLLDLSNTTLGAYEIRKSKQIFYNRLKNQTPENADIKNLFLYYDLRTSLPDDLLMYTDKITMHFGLECRVPILDNELIEFIESVNSSHKYNTRNGKIIHKAFASEYLPSSIINRKKIGFKSPTESWFRTHQETILSIFNSSIVFKEIFNVNRVTNMVKAHSGGLNLEKQIFLLLAIYYFLENTKYKKGFLAMEPFTA